MAARPWRLRAAFFLCGLVLVLSFAPFGWHPIAFLLLLPLLHGFRHARPRRAAEWGFALGAGLFLAGTYWLYTSIHVFGEAPLLLAVLLMLALVLIMACYYALFGWLLARFHRTSLPVFVLFAPASWVLIEWLRGWLMSGFPWMTLGYSQIDSPLASFAPVVGVYGVSFVLVLSAAALLAAAVSAGQTRVLMLLLAVLPWAAGLLLKQVAWTDQAGPAVVTTIVQGGVSQDRKWLREQFGPTLEIYRSSLAAHPDSELVIWPEVAIPAVLDQVESFVAQLEQDVAARDSTLLFGILERERATDNVYNSVVAIDGQSRQVYRKRHLVPFGEYFPVPDFVREWMRLMNLPYSDISAGADVQPLMRLGDGNRLAVAICYEDAYGAEQLYALPETTILVNVSNDAWFGNSIAPHQHLEIARMRALEVGRSAVRATNNGVSAFIDSDGSVVRQGPQFEYLAMSHAVVPRSGQTPYARFGNWPILLIALLICLTAGWQSRSRSEKP